MFTVTVPATSANLGSGFDTLGLAMDLFLKVDVELSAHSTEITWQGEGKERAEDPKNNNLLLTAISKVFYEAGSDVPQLKLSIKNEIPIGKGLGSSAAAITAGMTAANRILQGRFSQETLLKWAMEMEGHADNVVPAFYGGLTVCMIDEGEVFFQRIDFPPEIKLVLAVPDFEMPTEQSRQLLPRSISLKDMVSNLQRACFLLASIVNREYSDIDRAMDDRIFQPVRQKSIPGFQQILAMTREAGALGTAISGSGPSLIAWTMEKDQVGKAMQEAFAQNGIQSRIFFLNACQQGVKLEQQ